MANHNPTEGAKQVCPGHAGGNNYWPSSFSQKTKLVYVPALSNCEEIAIDTAKHSKTTGWSGGSFKNSERYESNLTAIDPLTGEVKKNVHLRYPNYSGALIDRGRTCLYRTVGRNRRSIGRRDARATMENQCRLRIHGAADDL